MRVLEQHVEEGCEVHALRVRCDECMFVAVVRIKDARSVSIKKCGTIHGTCFKCGVAYILPNQNKVAPQQQAQK